MEMARVAWRNTAVIMRSLGRRVPVEWISRELRVAEKLDYDVEEFLIVDETFAFRFRSERDREATMEARPWLVASQLLAIKCWQPNFVPGAGQLCRVVVWLRLPSLSMEYWAKEMIWDIAAKAGRPLALDKVTDQLGFTHVKIELDAHVPIRSGTFIQVGSDLHWQAFRYENLPIFCYKCARLGYEEGPCPFPPTTSATFGEPEDHRTQQIGTEEFPQEPTPELKEGDELVSRLPFGPWLTTTKIRQLKSNKSVKKPTASKADRTQVQKPS
ncbi:uncharacterized protein LOC120104243 [Phoenix dactylifera]|uniref:Uncharacterized protein LOC120104243 n=1 Tax=Phoenix dactylifera TaxID=42345 RepID=A0A8B8ZAB0_PHODC|nr:uncharacterized protein LOC120104243 [Phoenix dactylifera]